MEKKLLIMILILTLVVSLCACNDSSSSGDKSGDKTVETTLTKKELKEDETTKSGEELIEVEEKEDAENIIVEETESGEVEMVKYDYNDSKRYKDVERNPIVTMEMKDGGKVLIELYPQIAPTTVENFISLINQGYYNGLTFHRVMPSFMAQGGDPLGNGTGGPGYTIKGEFANNGFKQNNLKHDVGVISMARATPPDSAGSQFFIVTGETSYTSLDNQYAGFGKVVDGMDVVYEIVNTPVNFATDDLQKIYMRFAEGNQELSQDEVALVQAYNEGVAFDRPLNPPVIKTMTVDTFGVEYLEPQKIKE